MAKPFPDDLTLLHNPRCSKSRTAKALLDEQGIKYRERRYLEDPLTGRELEELRRRLGRPSIEWVRRGEDEFKQAKLTKDSGDSTILAAMAKHPVLIERPILIAANRAIVGRPPELVLELVGS